MATAICSSCSTLRHWSAGRGSRLADLRCTCGGPLVRAQWRDERYQQPLPRIKKPRVAALPDSDTGTIFATLHPMESFASHPARAGDQAIWKRNGGSGTYTVRILAFRGRSVKIELLSHTLCTAEQFKPRKPVWVKSGFLRLTPHSSLAAA